MNRHHLYILFAISLIISCAKTNQSVENDPQVDLKADKVSSRSNDTLTSTKDTKRSIRLERMDDSSARGAARMGLYDNDYCTSYWGCGDPFSYLLSLFNQLRARYGISSLVEVDITPAYQHQGFWFPYFQPQYSCQLINAVFTSNVQLRRLVDYYDNGSWSRQSANQLTYSRQMNAQEQRTLYLTFDQGQSKSFNVQISVSPCPGTTNSGVTSGSETRDESRLVNDYAYSPFDAFPIGQTGVQVEMRATSSNGWFWNPRRYFPQ